MEHAAADRVGGGAIDRRLDQRDCRVVRLNGRGGGSRPLHERDAIESLRQVLGHSFPKVQGPLEMRLHLRERVAPLGGLGGRHRGGEGLRQVSGGEPVIGQLGVGAGVGRAGRMLGEARGEGGMEAPAFTRQQLVLDGLLHERMSELVPVLALVARFDHEHVLGDRISQGRSESIHRDAGHVREPGSRNAAPRSRDAPEDALRAIRQLPDAGQQHLAQRIGKVGGRSLRGQELLGKERVASRAPKHRVRQRCGRIGPKDRPHQFGRLAAVEATQVDSCHAVAPPRFGQEGIERMPPVDLVAAQGADQGEPRRADVSDEERDKAERRPIRPVQVLEHKDRRLLLGESLEEAEDQLVNSTLLLG